MEGMLAKMEVWLPGSQWAVVGSLNRVTGWGWFFFVSWGFYIGQAYAIVATHVYR